MKCSNNVRTTMRSIYSTYMHHIGATDDGVKWRYIMDVQDDGEMAVKCGGSIASEDL